MDLHVLAAVLDTAHHSTSASPIVLALAGFIGGLAVGLTGMGGGALMTPALVLLFKVDPKVAVASDLVNSLVMKPIGGGVHLRRGTIHWRLVALMAAGSVPAAFAGAFLLNQFGDSKHVQTDIKALLGWALLVASTAIIAKAVKGDEMKMLSPEVAKQAETLAKAKDLKAAREAFKPLSASLIKYLADNKAGKGTYHEAYCPMVKASWLQKGKDIKNPYMGKEMPACGTLKN